LRGLRKAGGYSGNQFARKLGWPQSKVSKIETSRQLPTEEDLREWVSVLQQSDIRVEELQSLLDSARVDYGTFRERFRAAGGAAGDQAKVLARETRASLIRSFQPAMIHGLLQTGEYARELLHLPTGPRMHGANEDDITRMVAVRLQRQQQALYQPTKHVHVIMLEAALRTRLTSSATLLGQLDRLGAITGLPTVEIGIVPFTANVRVFPLAGFDIYDGDLVVVESVMGELELADPETVKYYGEVFAELQAGAAYGNDAIRVIRAAMAMIKNNS